MKLLFTVDKMPLVPTMTVRFKTVENMEDNILFTLISFIYVLNWY